MKDFEKLGAFYLGRAVDEKNKLTLYDSRDMMTHAMCVGMTGSGKTGLCIGVLEEAAIDGIPAIIVDPKGDMTNLMLQFPDLLADDFRPWLNADDAARKGITVDELAESEADKWKSGLESYGQTGERIRKMQETTDFVLYTPGSMSGRPVSILKLLDVPKAAVLQDPETFNEYVSGTSRSLLGLLGLDADPLNSRDHILLSTILNHAWRGGENLSIQQLIEQIMNPAFAQVGVMPVDAFYPEKDRFNLALQFNNLLASPQFEAWTKGDALDIQNLLYSKSGKPRLSILSIAHLNDQERMFFVTLLLNRLVGWMRQQQGTSSLRALFYMDEIYGYFPPVSNPPSKEPLLTLLKQARAYGVGIMLTTQNPVDLDYKGLANMGTWFIGRLQTERDKARLLDGLESAVDGGIDRSEVDQLLSGLKPRQFFMNNVHDSEPTLFESRFVMSYLAGPLSRDQISRLVSTTDAAHDEAIAPALQEQATLAPLPQAEVVVSDPAVKKDLVSSESMSSGVPQIPRDIATYFVPSRAVTKAVYRPGLFGLVEVYFSDSKNGIEHSREEYYTTLMTDGLVSVDWADAPETDLNPDMLEAERNGDGVFEPLPQSAQKKTSYTGWSRDLKDYVYRTSHLSLYRNRSLKAISRPDETERDFVIRLQMETREQRDEDLDGLRAKYEKAKARFEERVRKAEQAVEREKQQASDSKMQTMISIGSTILGSFLGKKAVSASTVGRATTAAKSASRSARQAGDVDRAKETFETLVVRLQDLEAEFEADAEALHEKYDGTVEKLEAFDLKPLKRDIKVRAVTLTWLPYEQDANGKLKEAW